jgi:hypothetical protein
LSLYLLLIAALPSVLRADIFTFGGADFIWYHDSGSGLATPNHIWAAGDYWEQSLTASHSQAGEFDFHLVYNDNSLGQALNMEVLVNNLFVGDFSISPGQSSSDLSFVTTFIGPTYDIRLEAINTIPVGENAVSLDTSGLSTASFTLVPEPDCMALLSAGLAGLVITIRNKFRK